MLMFKKIILNYYFMGVDCFSMASFDKCSEQKEENLLSIITDLVNNSTAFTLAVLSVTIIGGIMLGKVRFWGINLGIAGVLFFGIILGHLRIAINDELLYFIRDFGLLLFVYAIGMQVGPSFFASLQKQGLKLNILAILIVLAGVVSTIAVSLFGGIKMPVAVGLLAGGTTNTPSLAAAQQALRDISHGNQAMVNLPAVGYALAYPFGVLGIILTMIIIRLSFKINIAAEVNELSENSQTAGSHCEELILEVNNPAATGRPLQSIPELMSSGLNFLIVKHGDDIAIIRPGTQLYLGDIIMAKGSRQQLDRYKSLIGEVSKVKISLLSNQLTSKNLLVTENKALGKSVVDLNLTGEYGLIVTEVTRNEVKQAFSPKMRLRFGDILTVIGDNEALDRARKVLGDSVAHYNHPQLIPLFIGIALGVVLGILPIPIPGIPVPLRLGLAGGPLLVALILARVNRIGPLVWHIPAGANLMLREFGIALFLGCVGLKAGNGFMETLVKGDGLYWMLCAAFITFVPLILVGLFARVVYKINYITICGLLAGSMTDPPALAFAQSLTNSATPAISYANVYPLVMLLRIFSIQIIIFFCYF
jgi:putative transport protein